MDLMEQHIIAGFEYLQKLQNQDVALTPYLKITQEKIDTFAELSMDQQWIHVDPERAKTESPFKGTIAHGLFSLAMAAHFLMGGVKMQGVQYGLVTGVNYVRFVSAVPVGSLIRGRVRLMRCERLKSSTQAVWLVTVERDGGVLPACVAEFMVRYYD